MNEYELKNWLIDYLLPYFERNELAIDEHTSFDSLGLDSLNRVTMINELEKVLQRRLDPVLGYDYPTIHSLVQQLLLLEPTS